jgi:hypothetical protein
MASSRHSVRTGQRAHSDRWWLVLFRSDHPVVGVLAAAEGAQHPVGLVGQVGHGFHPGVLMSLEGTEAL